MAIPRNRQRSSSGRQTLDAKLILWHSAVEAVTEDMLRRRGLFPPWRQGAPSEIPTSGAEDTPVLSDIEHAGAAIAAAILAATSRLEDE